METVFIAFGEKLATNTSHTDHLTMNLIDVSDVLIKNFEFKPTFHVNYQETVLAMKDGLKKFKDLPKAAGGSGEEVSEQAVSPLLFY